MNADTISADIILAAVMFAKDKNSAGLTVSTKLDVVNFGAVEDELLALLLAMSLPSFLSFSFSFSPSLVLSSFFSFSLESLITELEPEGGGKSSLVAVPFEPTKIRRRCQ